jgi:hypothetical protein
MLSMSMASGCILALRTIASRAALFGLAIGFMASNLAAIAPAYAARPDVAVPVGSGNPVLIDGHLDPEEWRDAKAVDGGDSIVVMVKEYRGHVFLAIRCPFNWVAYTDLFVGLENGEFWNLHASSQLGERRIERAALGDTLPRARWGFTEGWYANETRFDRDLAQSLVRQEPGRDRARMLLDTTYPYDGFEFQLKRSRFPGKSYRLRVELNPGFPGLQPRAFPSASKRDDPDTWGLLRFGTRP